MANRQIKVDILSDEKNFVSGTNKAGTSATKLSQVLAKLGPVGQVAQTVLDKLGLSSITAGAGIAGGVTAALGVSAAMIEKAINSYLAITDSIRNYSFVTGQSAEASSRQVTAFGELGVSEDLAQAAMLKLGKTAEETPQKLEKLGVQVEHDANGNLNLGATLINVMNAYQGTTDAGQRALIVFNAFGKGGQAMIPILETNVEKLKQMEAAVGKVYTQADLDNAKRYEVSQKQLGQGWSDMVSSIGGAVIPVLGDLFQNQLALAYANDQLTKSYQAGKITYEQYTSNNADLLKGYEKDYIAAQNAKAGIDALAQSQQEAANAAKADAAAENTLYDSIHKSVDAGFALEQANIDLTNAQATVAGESLKDVAAAQKVTDAQATLKTALDKYGDTSIQAANATIALEQAQAAAGATGETAIENNLRLREATVKVADATIAQTEAEAGVSNITMIAGAKADILRAALEKLAGQLGPNDPLRKQLQGYIDELNSIPSKMNTTIGYTTVREVQTANSGHSGLQSFAGGGMVSGPSSEHPVMAKAGESVFTPEQLAALGGMRGRTGPAEIHIHIEGGLYADGPGIDRFTNAIAQRLSFVLGT